MLPDTRSGDERLKTVEAPEYCQVAALRGSLAPRAKASHAHRARPPTWPRPGHTEGRVFLALCPLRPLSAGRLRCPLCSDSDSLNSARFGVCAQSAPAPQVHGHGQQKCRTRSESRGPSHAKPQQMLYAAICCYMRSLFPSSRSLPTDFIQNNRITRREYEDGPTWHAVRIVIYGAPDPAARTEQQSVCTEHGDQRVISTAKQLDAYPSCTAVSAPV